MNNRTAGVLQHKWVARCAARCVAISRSALQPRQFLTGCNLVLTGETENPASELAVRPAAVHKVCCVLALLVVAGLQAGQVAQQFGLEPAAMANEQTFVGSLTKFIQDTVGNGFSTTTVGAALLVGLSVWERRLRQ